MTKKADDFAAALKARADKETAALAPFKARAEEAHDTFKQITKRVTDMRAEIQGLRSEAGEIAEQLDAIMAEAEAVEIQTAAGAHALNEIKAVRTAMAGAGSPRASRAPVAAPQREEAMKGIERILERRRAREAAAAAKSSDGGAPQG